MNHLTVKIFDISLSKITSNVLDMCTTKGVTAADIFDVNTQNQISWDKCVAFSVDNAYENMGKRNAIKSRVLEKNLNVYFVVCPCHKAHKYG
jgi:hypothetical protein